MPSERKSIDCGDGDCADAKASSRSSSRDAKADAKTLSARADAKDRSSSGDDSDGHGDADLVSKVIAFFFDDDAFAQTFERFAETHCHVFDVASDEMKLEYTEIYNDFVALFDAKLEAFIASQGATTDEFYRLVRRAYASDRESSVVLCAEILVATADFDVFVLMMKQTKESLALAKH